MKKARKVKIQEDRRLLKNTEEDKKLQSYYPRSVLGVAL